MLLFGCRLTQIVLEEGPLNRYLSIRFTVALNKTVVNAQHKNECTTKTTRSYFSLLHFHSVAFVSIQRAKSWNASLNNLVLGRLPFLDFFNFIRIRHIDVFFLLPIIVRFNVTVWCRQQCSWRGSWSYSLHHHRTHTHRCSWVSEWVSEQFLNGTSAHMRIFSALQWWECDKNVKI